jgi:hypothetical protein
VLIARTFGWFHDDFGSTDKDLLGWLVPYLHDPALQFDLVECLNDLQFEVRCGHWNFEVNLWERPASEVADARGALILPCAGFRRELGSERTAAIRLFGQEVSTNETHLYRTHFHNRYLFIFIFVFNLFNELIFNIIFNIIFCRPHSNFMCKDSDEGAVVICVGREESLSGHESEPGGGAGDAPASAPGPVPARKKTGSKPLLDKKYRVLIRTPKADTQIVLSAPGQKELFESLRAVYPFADKRTLVQIEDPKFCDSLLALDETLVFIFIFIYYYSE